MNQKWWFYMFFWKSHATAFTAVKEYFKVIERQIGCKVFEVIPSNSDM